MKTICYIVPYFGKLPPNFQIWLQSCSKNKTIDWIIFTNDKTDYNYPDNVKVHYCEFDYLKELIQRNFDFKIEINSYWRLSLFKPAYGEIFKEYLDGYDFWGHCDIDLLWGDIRKFITDDILNKYDKVGFQGHSTLYRNNNNVNKRYKTIVPNKVNYKEVFLGDKDYSFDENGMEIIYDYLKIPYYKETNFAHLSKYDYSFVLKYLPKEFDYKNKRQIFTWENGNLYRYFIGKDEKIHREEFMYIHFFCRPITYKVKEFEIASKYVMYPDILKPLNEEITISFIKKHGKNPMIKYFIKSIYVNRHKLTTKKIYGNIKRMIAHKLLKKY